MDDRDELEDARVLDEAPLLEDEVGAVSDVRDALDLLVGGAPRAAATFSPVAKSLRNASRRPTRMRQISPAPGLPEPDGD